ncbi:MAG: hypothetical protein V4598_10225 [Bdellovibrionota bacterium]
MFALILFLSLNIFAGTLVSTAPKYDLKWDDKTITYKDESFSVEFTRKKCNEIMYINFLDLMDAFPKGEYLRKGKGEINYTWNGKQLHEPLNSERRKKLLAIPQELRRMKLENKLACPNLK